MKYSQIINNLRSVIGDTPNYRDSLIEKLAEQNELLKLQLEISQKQLDLGRQQLSNLQLQSNALENMRLVEMLPLRHEIKANIGDRQLSLLGTVERIRDSRQSFARFGDGELRLMFRPEFDIKFQKNSPGLTKDLQRVMMDPSSNLLLGMPHIFGNAHWSGVFAELWHLILPALPKSECFGDSHVTRPLYFSFLGQEGVEAWRSVWANRDAAVLAGRGSRFELIPQMFNTLKSSVVIESSPAHAYDDIERTVELTIKSGRDLALIALGPSGTIIADQLNQRGVQAIDIGHIAASYRNVFQGELFPEQQPITSKPTAQRNTSST